MRPPTSSRIFDSALWQEAQRERFLFALTAALNVAISSCLVAQAYLISRIVADVFLSNARIVAVENLLGALLLVMGLRAILVSAAEVSARSLAIRIKSSLRNRLFQHLQRLGPSFVEGERTGELINTLNEGIEALDPYFSQYLPQLLTAVLAPLIILVAVSSGDLLSAGILLVTAPLIPLFMALIGAGARKVTERQWQSLSYMSAHFLDVLQGLPTLRILGQSKAQIEKVARISKQYGEATMRVLRVSFLSALVLELAATLSVAVIAVQIGLRLLEGRLLFNDALFILVLAPEFYAPMRMLGARFHAGMEGVSAGARIFDLLHASTPHEQSNIQRQAPPPQPAPIRFCHVSHAFANGERPALHDVSLDIEPGTHVAVVGESGAGKSTLLQLLFGFIQPQAGEILIGDVPLNELDSELWLEQIAWASQAPYLLNDTIAANIRMGNSEASDEAVIAAAKMADIDEFISSLPHGYDSIVGEHGARLSGGQAQRVALARAFLKGAPIVVLDEPTANLDPATEKRVQDAIQSLAGHCTVVTVTHRLNTIMNADLVIVLRKGRLEAQGRPQELLRESGSTPDTVLVESRFAGQFASSADVHAPLLALRQGARSGQMTLTVEKVDDFATAQPANTISPLRQLFEQLRGHWRHICASVALGAMTVGSSIGLLGTSAYLISMAALQPSIAELSVSIVGVRFFGLTRGIARYLERLATHTVTFRLLAQMRTWAFSTLEPLVPARVNASGSGDLLSRVGSDVSTLEEFYVRAVAPPLTALVVWIGACSLLWWFHWQLALILASGLLLSGIVLPLLVAFITHRHGQGLIAARAKLETALVDALQGMADVIAFGKRKQFAGKIEDLSSVLARLQQRLAYISASRQGFSNLLADLTAWTMLVVSVLLVQEGTLGGVYVAAVVLITMAAFEAVNPLPEAALHLDNSLHAAQRLFEMGRWTPSVREPEHPLPRPKDAAVQVRDLSFRYAPKQRPALRTLHLDLPQGKRMAIVGPSGAGKSSIANLLLRFWNFDEGQITLNGADIGAYHGDDVRMLLNVITQKTFLFNASIGDNIRLARPTASMDDIISAARVAQLDDFIRSLADGYDTMIGERGVQISAGQRQRLALARALIRPAPILLLDEPTANLDVDTEQALLRAVYECTPSRTIVYIGHRLVFMDMFDEIVVLQEGCIVEQGTHDALLQREGLYAHLWRLQQGATFAVKRRFRTDAVS